MGEKPWLQILFKTGGIFMVISPVFVRDRWLTRGSGGKGYVAKGRMVAKQR